MGSSIRNGPKLAANGDNKMRTIIALSSLGLTLALSGAAHATPVNRSAFLERAGSASESVQSYYRHKRYYRQDEERTRDQRANTHRQAPQGNGTARPGVRKPAVTPEPAVFREPVARQRPQIV
jgi:hypothetical protein